MFYSILQSLILVLVLFCLDFKHSVKVVLGALEFFLMIVMMMMMMQFCIKPLPQNPRTLDIARSPNVPH